MLLDLAIFAACVDGKNTSLYGKDESGTMEAIVKTRLWECYWVRSTYTMASTFEKGYAMSEQRPLPCLVTSSYFLCPLLLLSP